METFKEFGAYSWDEKKTGDAVIKENDHCLAGDTLVDTVRGPVRIDELVGKCGSVHCTDEERRAVGFFHDVRMTQKEAEVLYALLIEGRFPYAVWSVPVFRLLIVVGFVAVATLAAIHAPAKRMREMAVTETINEL